MIDIQNLKALNRLENIAVTEHARKRLIERNISVRAIVYCIEKDEIIEQYEDDKPFPSCLIIGPDLNNKSMHVVLSYDEEYIYLITAYYPSPEKWESDLKTRKE